MTRQDGSLTARPTEVSFSSDYCAASGPFDSKEDAETAIREYPDTFPGKSGRARMRRERDLTPEGPEIALPDPPAGTPSNEELTRVMGTEDERLVDLLRAALYKAVVETVQRTDQVEGVLVARVVLAGRIGPVQVSVAWAKGMTARSCGASQAPDGVSARAKLEQIRAILAADAAEEHPEGHPGAHWVLAQVKAVLESGAKASRFIVVLRRMPTPAELRDAESSGQVLLVVVTMWGTIELPCEGTHGMGPADFDRWLGGFGLWRSEAMLRPFLTPIPSAAANAEREAAEYGASLVKSFEERHESHWRRYSYPPRR